MQAKLELRKAMLARRDSLVSEVRTRLSDRIAKSIVEMPGFRQADVVPLTAEQAFQILDARLVVVGYEDGSVSNHRRHQGAKPGPLSSTGSVEEKAMSRARFFKQICKGSWCLQIGAVESPRGCSP